MKEIADNNTHIFETSFGRIQGEIKNGVIKARNIRYAYSQRYQLPVPINSIDPNIPVPDKIPVCPQNIRPLLEKMIEVTHIENFDIDESPQYLTITRPEKIVENEKLPVIIWIHGGSYEVGCGTLPTTDAVTWVKEQNIIVVSVSYRLGLFGFLGDGKSRLPNLGLFDMIEALKWVKKYIEDFGGDANCITLFGQSSGGDAAAHLMIADGVEDLFHRVIIQSAPLGLRHGRGKMSAEFAKKTEYFKNETDVMKMVEDYKPLVPSLIKYGLKAGMPFGLQYGSAPLCYENEAEDRWKQNAKKYDVLIGMNNDETAFFLSTSEVINKYASKGLGKKIIGRSIRATTEKIYGKPAKAFAKDYADAGGNVYLFRLYSGLKNHPLCAAHCIDLPLIFGNESAWRSAGLLKDIPWSYIHQNGQKLRKVWAGFARTGNIDDKDKPEILEVEKVKCIFR
jgi:para-nitrobenzyl esterase